MSSFLFLADKKEKMVMDLGDISVGSRQLREKISMHNKLNIPILIKAQVQSSSNASQLQICPEKGSVAATRYS